MIAVYPGSFDPPTFGHIDIIQRAAKISAKLIVAVANNSAKSPLFTPAERVDMLRQICSDIKNVEVVSFSGLLIDYVQSVNAGAIIRGLRFVSDFEYEFQMAQANNVLNNQVETLFICTSTKYSYLSSSIVKEVASLGGDIKKMTHEIVLNNILQKNSNM